MAAITNACADACMKAIPTTSKKQVSGRIAMQAGLSMLNPLGKNPYFGISCGWSVADQGPVLWQTVCVARELHINTRYAV